jgi:hypothetical protein
MRLKRAEIALSFICILVASQSLHQRTLTAQAGPLQLRLTCETERELVFRFALQNINAAPTAAVIGSILANDKKYLPGALSFTLKRAGEAGVSFDWFDPSVPGVAGRVDPWLIPFPPGAGYSVTVGIPNEFRHLFTSPAEVRIRLTTGKIGERNDDMQGLQFIHVWTGTLTSDWLRFPESCSGR